MKSKILYLELNKKNHVQSYKDQDNKLVDIVIHQKILNAAAALVAGSKEVLFSYQTAKQRFWVKLSPQELQSWEKIEKFLANHAKKMQEDKDYAHKWAEKSPKLSKKIFAQVKGEIRDLLTDWMESNPSIKKSLLDKARTVRAVIKVEEIPSISKVLSTLEAKG